MQQDMKLTKHLKAIMQEAKCLRQLNDVWVGLNRKEKRKFKKAISNYPMNASLFIRKAFIWEDNDPTGNWIYWHRKYYQIIRIENKNN